VSGNMRTPGFDNNDITFFRNADYVWMSANILPLWTKPTTWYRQLLLIGGGQQQYNFQGDLTDRQMQLYGQMQTLNYWNLSSYWIHRPEILDDRLTRGGPVVRRPGRDDWFASVNTDSRRRIVLKATGQVGCNREGYCNRSLGVQAQVRPSPNVQLSIGPSWSRSATGAQYVQTVADAFDTAFYFHRYVFAALVDNTLAMETRLNVTFSPALTLEVYAQPLIESDAYSGYREFAVPRQLRKVIYGVDVGTDSVPAGAPQQHWIDPDGPTGHSPKFLINDPSSTLRSLRGNVVLRWEYRPGSTLFLVWTRSGSSQPERGQIDFREDAGALFRGPSSNVVLLKVNYWLGF